MSTEDNKALARRLIEEAWNQGNLATVDELIAVLATWTIRSRIRRFQQYAFSLH
jgi:hypothetical protein